MSRRIPKEIRELAIWAAQYGWRWEMTGNAHIKWIHPAVPKPVFSPHTPRTPDSAKPKQKMRAAFREATGRDMEVQHG